MAGVIADDQDLLKCPICLSQFEVPVTVPCGHSYCEGCISRCFKSQERSGVHHRCPACRQTFTSRPMLKKNVILATLLEQRTTPSTAVKQRPSRESREAQRRYQCVIQDREKELQELKKAVKTLKSSAQSALEDTDMIFKQMMRHIKSECCDVLKLIIAQEEAELSRAEKLSKHLEQEIAELKRRDAELGQLSHTEDHIDFLKTVPSVSSLPGSSKVPCMTVKSCGVATVKKLSILRHQLQDVCEQVVKNVSKASVSLDVDLTVRVCQAKTVMEEPLIREEFLQYYRHFTLNPEAAGECIYLSEGKRVAENRGLPWTPRPLLGGNEDRQFNISPNQVLCREGVSGRCYWEVEVVSGNEVYIEVTYKSKQFHCQSWTLITGVSRPIWMGQLGGYKIHEACPRIGVYVDKTAGLLAFYTVSDSGTMKLVHKQQTKFKETLYPGFQLFENSTLRLLSPSSL